MARDRRKSCARCFVVDWGNIDVGSQNVDAIWADALTTLVQLLAAALAGLTNVVRELLATDILVVVHIFMRHH